MHMRVLMLEAPEALLAERARLGHDRWDEMWDGVLHMVPAPYRRHQKLVHELGVMLDAAVKQRGLEITHETNLHRPGRDDDYRIPDIAIYGLDVASDRGVEGGALTIFEIRSPNDESYEKLPFYLDPEVGVGEVVIINRDTLTVEIFRGLDDDGAPILAEDTTLTSVAVTLRRVDDDHLELSRDDAPTATIDLG